MFKIEYERDKTRKESECTAGPTAKLPNSPHLRKMGSRTCTYLI